MRAQGQAAAVAKGRPLDIGEVYALFARRPKSSQDQDVATPPENLSPFPCQICARCICGDPCVVNETATDDRAAALNSEGVAAAPTADVISFPYLTPLKSYERQFGHRAAEGAFIASVWLREDGEPAS